MIIDYIIFDYGGTIDTNGIHWGNLIWDVYQKCGVNLTEEQFKLAYVHAERFLGTHPMIKPEDTFQKTLTEKIDIQVTWLYDHGFLKVPFTELRPLKSAIVAELYKYARRTTRQNINVLNILKSDGYKLGLVSNFYGNIRTVLSEFRLDNLFDTVVESAEVHIRKPNPQIYGIAAERLGIKDASRVLVVGDSLEKDITPAKSLGYNTAWIIDQQTSGMSPLFGGKLSGPNVEIPDLIIGKLAQLLEYTEANPPQRIAV